MLGLRMFSFFKFETSPIRREIKLVLLVAHMSQSKRHFIFVAFFGREINEHFKLIFDFMTIHFDKYISNMKKCIFFDFLSIF